MTGSIQKQQQKIKKQMRDDILGTQSLANQLSGSETIGTAKLNKTDKTKAKTTQPTQVVDGKKLDKFLDFMQKNYKDSLVNVELKRRI